MMGANGIDVEPDVLQDFVKLANKLLSRKDALNKADQDTIAILKFHAERKLESYDEAARRHINDMERLMEMRQGFPVEKYLIPAIGALVILSVIIVIMQG